MCNHLPLRLILLCLRKNRTFLYHVQDKGSKGEDKGLKVSQATKVHKEGRKVVYEQAKGSNQIRRHPSKFNNSTSKYQHMKKSLMVKMSKM